MATKTAKKKPDRSITPATKRGYRDLREHIEALKKAGLLVVVDRPINKDTEMHPLVRWQFRGGLPESDRRAFLFTNVTDAKGKKYDIPVLVCGIAGSQESLNLDTTYSIASAPASQSVRVLSESAIAQSVEAAHLAQNGEHDKPGAKIVARQTARIVFARCLRKRCRKQAPALITATSTWENTDHGFEICKEED